MANNKVEIENNLTLIRSLITKHKRHDHIFAGVGMFIIISLTITLLVLFLDLVFDGYPRFNLDFLTNFPSRRATAAGILSAWVGSSLVLIVTFFAAVPLGIAAGVYLEEYAKKNWFSDLIEINVTNLAGVPSIIYGLLALVYLSIVLG
jgi:phosphate transport system permease protein